MVTTPECPPCAVPGAGGWISALALPSALQQVDRPEPRPGSAGVREGILPMKEPRLFLRAAVLKLRDQEDSPGS